MSAVVENNLIHVHDDTVRMFVMDVAEYGLWAEIESFPVEVRLITPDPKRPWHVLMSAIAKEDVVFQIPKWADVPVQVYAKVGVFAAPLNSHAIITPNSTLHVATVGQNVMTMEIGE